jgi:hypothetical protein
MGARPWHGYTRPAVINAYQKVEYSSAKEPFAAPKAFHVATVFSCTLA